MVSVRGILSVVALVAACNGTSRVQDGPSSDAGTGGSSRGGSTSSAQGGTGGSGGNTWGDPLDCDDLGYDTDAYEYVFGRGTESYDVLGMSDDGTLLELKDGKAVFILRDGTTYSGIDLSPLAELLGEEPNANNVHALADGKVLLGMSATRGGLFDLKSGMLTTFDAPEGRRFGAYSWGSELIYVETGIPYDAGAGPGALGTDTIEDRRFEVRALDGSVVTTGVPLGRWFAVFASKEEIAWAAGNELVGIGFDGTERYRYDLGAPIDRFSAAADGSRFLVTLDDTLRWVDTVHDRVDDTLMFDLTLPLGTLSPSGTYGAVEFGDGNHLVGRLLEGQVVSMDLVASSHSMSIDVSDEGTLAVSGRGDDDYRVLVELWTRDGVSVLRCFHPGNVSPPSLRFTSDARWLVAYFYDRIRFFPVPSP